MSLNKTSETFKYEIPQSCYVSMMKKVLIEKMQAKWFLASHPYPRIEGEMIVFKPKKEDQTQGKDVIIYRDYSLRKRVETTPRNVIEQQAMRKKASKLGKKDDDKKEDEPEPKLQCLEIDTTDPLLGNEWVNFAQVIDETQGLGWF